MSLNNLSWSLDYYEKNVEECNNTLNSFESYDDIPLLNSKSFQSFSDGALVRYQGMVQDMLNPEYYSSTFIIINKENNESCVKSGKFRDLTYCKVNEELKFNEDDFTPKERLVYFCIPLPGTNSWVQDHKKKEIKCEHNDKSSGIKREATDCEEDMETNQIDSTSQSNTKKNKISEINENKAESSNNAYINTRYFPFADAEGLPCIIKIYEEEEILKIVLNDRIEVIGFLSLNPALEASWEDSDPEDKALHPPPSLVPRIHAIKVKKLQHNNPMLKQIIPYGNINLIVESARSDLHLVLTQLLFEDTVAADYLLCHLLSRIYIRNDGNAIGKFSLNLFNINLKSFGSCLNNVIKRLVTNSYFIPLSTSLLNERSFVPKKDYETNRLCSGLLQLCDDIHLILDETTMNEGQLNNIGCLNVAALQRLFRDQEVHYDFGYYPVTYNANVPLLVLSEGKSMFETDIRLKVKSELITEANLKESFQAISLYLSEEICNKIRCYLTSMRLQDFELGEEMVRKIGEDYVSMRQQDRQVNSSDLHALLTLSRLLALSHGRTTLDIVDWNRAIEMETERKIRIR